MIRKAQKKDAEGLAIVLKDSYNIDSVEEAKKVFLDETKKGNVYLVAIIDEKIVGIVSGFFHGLPKHGLAELDRIAVLPDYRGKGIAKELFGGLVDHFDSELKKKGKKLRKMFLMTHESNSRAHSFYEKRGMKKEAVLKNHFYNDEDERVYSLFF